MTSARQLPEHRRAQRRPARDAHGTALSGQCPAVHQGHRGGLLYQGGRHGFNPWSEKTHLLWRNVLHASGSQPLSLCSSARGAAATEAPTRVRAAPRREKPRWWEARTLQPP